MATNGKRDLSLIRDLVARMEFERSALACVQLAHALGYGVQVWPDAVELTKPGRRAQYPSVAALRRSLAREARRLVGRG